jgi:hypothetical protein
MVEWLVNNELEIMLKKAYFKALSRLGGTEKDNDNPQSG